MENNNQQNISTRKIWSIIITVVVVIVLLGAMTLIAFVLREKIANLDFGSKIDITEEGGEDQMPTSSLFFTAYHPGSSVTEEPVLTTYTKDTDDFNSALVRQELSELSKNGVDPEVSQISFSPNRDWITFVAKNQIALEGEVTAMDDAYAFQVYRAKVVKDSLEKTISNAEQITDAVAAHKSNPSINNNGEVLFNSRGIDTQAFNTVTSGAPDDWVVHYVNEEGVMGEVAIGLYPKWLDNGEFLYVSKEGFIHSYISNSEKSENLMLTLPVSLTDEVEGYDFSNLSPEMTSSPGAIFDVSDDNKFVVLYLPNFERAYSFHLVREGDSFSLKPIALINKASAAWLQISPDNKYAGLLTYGPPSYIIYSLDTFEIVGEPLYVGDFDIAQLKVTDWY